MNWKIRIFIFLLGLLTASLGLARLLHGPFAYQSMRGQTAFSTDLIGIGAVIAIIAFLPPTKWVYERITTRRKLQFTGNTAHHRSTSTRK